MNSDYSQWREILAKHATGRWDNILPMLSTDERIGTLLSGKANVTCPHCDHKRKFYMIKQEADTAKCRCCRCEKVSFDGIALAFHLGGYNRESDVCKKLEEILSIELQNDRDYQALKNNNSFKKSTTKSYSSRPSQLPVPKEKVQEAPKPNEHAIKLRKYLLSNLIDISDPRAALARKYFRSRGLDVDCLLEKMNGTLFFIEELKYFYQELDDKDKVIQTINKELPAIVAKVFSHKGELIGFHRIYLDPKTGDKADVPEPKLLAPAIFENDYGTHGCVVPLGPTQEEIGVCEGIETGLAVIQMSRHCWPLVDAYKLATFNPPKGVKVVNVYGDLDLSGTGQKQMIKLFNHLKLTRPEITVNLELPPHKYWDKTAKPKGIDFLDAFLLGFRFAA